MNKTTHKLRIFLLSAMLLSLVHSLQAQVTIGSGIPPTRAALLDLKTKQEAGAVASVSDTKNATSTEGGFLLPRVELVSIHTLEPFIAADDPEFVNNTNSLKYKLAGLMVYNITNNGVGSTLYPAVYTWNGELWVTSQANEAVSSIVSHPKKFTFYELGTETLTPGDALKFEVDGLGTWTYQWYQVTGNNVHVRIGTPVGQSGTIYTNAATANAAGATSKSFTPQAVIKGTTRRAGNTGFYRFYCIAESSLGARLESDIAEIAVGCGAKNNAGEWISFMCFNLGADNASTIASQKAYNIGSYTNNTTNAPGQHAYIANEERLWGSLFQWGRIADGHELRSFTGAGGTPTNTVARGAIATTDIGNGNRCSVSDTYRPYQQVRKTSTTWFGKFIYGNAAWTPIAQATSDMLWRTGRFVQNDPCAHYKDDGSYQEFWHEGTDQQNNGYAACSDAGTAWRTPAQDEWGNLYKGGTISGSPSTATANTWSWYGGTSTPINSSRGYEVKPDGATTTLFLPASGYRSNGNGLLYYQGAYGYYWSVSIISTNAYNLNFNSGNVNPANSNNRANGFALRCIKNS